MASSLQLTAAPPNPPIAPPFQVQQAHKRRQTMQLQQNAQLLAELGHVARCQRDTEKALDSALAQIAELKHGRADGAGGRAAGGGAAGGCAAGGGASGATFGGAVDSSSSAANVVSAAIEEGCGGGYGGAGRSLVAEGASVSAHALVSNGVTQPPGGMSSQRPMTSPAGTGDISHRDGGRRHPLVASLEHRQRDGRPEASRNAGDGGGSPPGAVQGRSPLLPAAVMLTVPTASSTVAATSPASRQLPQQKQVRAQSGSPPIGGRLVPGSMGKGVAGMIQTEHARVVALEGALQRSGAVMAEQSARIERLELLVRQQQAEAAEQLPVDPRDLQWGGGEGEGGGGLSEGEDGGEEGRRRAGSSGSGRGDAGSVGGLERCGEEGRRARPQTAGAGGAGLVGMGAASVVPGGGVTYAMRGVGVGGARAGGRISPGIKHGGVRGPGGSPPGARLAKGAGRPAGGAGMHAQLRAQIEAWRGRG